MADPFTGFGGLTVEVDVVLWNPPCHPNSIHASTDRVLPSLSFRKN